VNRCCFLKVDYIKLPTRATPYAGAFVTSKVNDLLVELGVNNYDPYSIRIEIETVTPDAVVYRVTMLVAAQPTVMLSELEQQFPVKNDRRNTAV